MAIQGFVPGIEYIVSAYLFPAPASVVLATEYFVPLSVIEFADVGWL